MRNAPTVDRVPSSALLSPWPFEGQIPSTHHRLTKVIKAVIDVGHGGFNPCLVNHVGVGRVQRESSHEQRLPDVHETM